jgi:hypothetical protein
MDRREKRREVILHGNSKRCRTKTKKSDETLVSSDFLTGNQTL